MQLFWKKASPGNGAFERPVLDKLLGDPDARRFRDDLAAGRWQGLHDFLEGTTDWALRHWYVRQLSDLIDRPLWLQEWVAARPDSAIPVLFRGSHGTHWAWRARGNGYAKSVRQDAWQVFHSRLVAADQDLARAAGLDPRDPCPLELSLPVARGLSLGQAEAQRRFDEAHRRDPWNYYACVDMVQATARKWGGSHEAMFGFARRVTGEAPDGHSAHAVVPAAHIEVFITLSGQESEQYFRAAAVQAEIRRAAAKSVQSSAYQPGLVSWSARNAFAFCFWQMRDRDALAAEVAAIGPRLVSSPWQYWGDAAGTYGKALKWLTGAR